MNIEAEKITLTKLLLETQDVNILNEVKEILNKDNKETDFWDELSPLEKEEIKQGLQELDSGKRISYKKLIREIS